MKLTEDTTNSTEEEVEINGTYSEGYLYLRQTMSFRNRKDKEIRTRVGNAWCQLIAKICSKQIEYP